MRCRICNADHAHYDPFDQQWYCQECIDVITETLFEYPEEESEEDADEE